MEGSAAQEEGGEVAAEGRDQREKEEREERVASGEERMMKEKGKKMTSGPKGKMVFLHHL